MTTSSQFPSGPGNPITSLAVYQVAHGFITGQAVYLEPSSPAPVWALAEANGAGTLGLGVAVVIDANNFIVYISGIVNGLSGLTAGQYYFVSDATPGLLTTTEPVSTSSYSNPLLFAVSATSGFILAFRPSQVGGAAVGILGLAGGGTDADLSGTGGPNEVLKQSTVGGAVTVGTLATVNLSDFNATPPGHSGEIPIWDATSGTYKPGDPYVQGVFPPGTSVLTANGLSPADPLNPVLIGAQNPSNLLENLHVDASGNLFTTAAGVSALVNAGNSSTAALNATLSFTGSTMDLVALGYTTVQVLCYADQQGTLYVQSSSDGTNWDHVTAANLDAGDTHSLAIGIQGRYARVVFTNGATNQGYFRLQTLLVPGPIQPTAACVGVGFGEDNVALSTHSVITGIARPSGNEYTDVEVSSSGAMLIATEGSVLGDTVTTMRRNQIEINFSSADATNAAIITNTASGTGAVTQANGEALYSTGTGAAGEAKGVTVASMLYRPANDIYVEFTAAFTTPTDATAAHDYQRVGLYDANNGLFIGYEGTVFGVAVRLAGSDTRVTLANFNLDPLNGSGSSGFTRAGVPEAVDFTKLNIYRIRFAWFGAGPAFFDIFTPDGAWLPFQLFRNPNLSNIPYIATPNLPITVDAFKTASDSTNLKIRVGCFAAGVTESAIRLSDPMVDTTLAIPTRSVITGRLPGGTYSNVGLTPDSALSVGGSGDAQIGAATWTTNTGSAVAYVNGAKNSESSGATTLTTTYTPTAGNLVVAIFNIGSTYSGLTVKDNLGNSLTAGPTVGQTTLFYYTAPAGAITGYVATWTTSRQASLTVAEYSGVNAVDAALAGNTNSGTSTTASITVTPDELGDIVVCGLSDVNSAALTATVGNSRQNVTTTTSPQQLMDTNASPATCTATLASSAWSAVALGLRPTIISGTALNAQVLMVSNTFAYNSVTVELVGSGTLLSGAITFEVSIDSTDGTNGHWTGLLGTNVTTGLTMSSAVFTLTSGTTCLSFNNTGFQWMRARLSTAIAGYGGQVVVSYTVQGLASPNVNSNITTGSINVNGNQGTPNSTANSWPTTITDGTNGPAAVKASTVAAVTTDAALVVQLSPNQPALTVALNVHDASPASQAITIVSGGVASGAFASGSIASGAIASGAVASGAIASGAIASGAIASGAIAAGAASTSGSGAFPDGSVFVRSNAASTFPVTATMASAQKIEVYDGTNTATVKAASTAAATTDTALVVAVSPNNNVLTTPAAPTTSIYSQAAISSTANPVVVVGGSGTKTVRIFRIVFQNAGASTTAITIQDSTPTNFSGAFNLLPNGSYQADGGGDPLFTTAAGKAFQLANSAGMQISGTVWYTAS